MYTTVAILELTMSFQRWVFIFCYSVVVFTHAAYFHIPAGKSEGTVHLSVSNCLLEKSYASYTEGIKQGMKNALLQKAHELATTDVSFPDQKSKDEKLLQMVKDWTMKQFYDNRVVPNDGKLAKYRRTAARLLPRLFVMSKSKAHDYIFHTAAKTVNFIVQVKCFNPQGCTFVLHTRMDKVQDSVGTDFYLFRPKTKMVFLQEELENKETTDPLALLSEATEKKVAISSVLIRFEPGNLMYEQRFLMAIPRLRILDMTRYPNSNGIVYDGPMIAKP